MLRTLISIRKAGDEAENEPGFFETDTVAHCVPTVKGEFAAVIPYPIQGLDCDNGSEFINHDVVAWAAGRDIFFTKSHPYRKTTKPPSSPRTTTWSAVTASTGTTIRLRS
jgi:hypothetical protein